MNRSHSLLAAALFLSSASFVHAQQLVRAAGPLPSYEVSTIKKAGPDSHNTTTALHYIQLAYGIPTPSTSRVIGAPGWLSTNQYVIEGKASDSVRSAMRTMKSEDSSRQSQLMQQSLLADRFHLKAHIEMRELPVYELLPAKGGIKMKPVADPGAAADLPPIPPPNQPLTATSIAVGTTAARIMGSSVEMLGHAVPTQALIKALLMQFEIEGRPIVDKTGLKGKYNFVLHWTAELPAAARGSAAASENVGPSLFTALQETLGLRLVAAKDPVEVLVIDHIDLPNEN